MNSELTSRIKVVIDHYGLSVSSFADAIGVQRSSISHILSGRNKPSLDFVMKLVKKYPEVNLYWLLVGTGNFLDIGKMDSPSIADSRVDSKIKLEHQVSSSLAEPIKMVVFYSDGTFESFEAKKE